MRCPKCGFVSYDLTETCGKCGKNISGASQELHGTVASVGAPGFLRAAIAETELEGAQGGEAEADFAFDLGGEEETVIDLGADEGPSLEAGSLDLGMEEAAAEPAAEEPVFAMPTEEPAAAGFEISDLAPPQVAADLAEEEAGEDLEFAAAEEAPPSRAQSAGLGLADLKVEGIDLEAAPAKGKAMHSVKTGTALDEFDIDLGELIPKKK
jgi:hypothetical protein